MKTRLRLVQLVLWVLIGGLASTLGWAGAVAAQGTATPALSTLDIALWPEYDQPAMLVIYRGQITPTWPLPADMLVRIPADALEGKPHAVAVNDPLQGLLNLPYTVETRGEWIEVAFQLNQPAFQVEFYDQLDTTGSTRRYALRWPGDWGIGEVSLQIQQPFGATDFRVSPMVEAGQRQADGLIYHAAYLGGVQAGQALTVELSYQQTDARTSVEALRLALPTPPAQAATTATVGTLGLPNWMLIGIGLSLALLIAGVTWQWVVPHQSPKASSYTPSIVRRESHAGGRTQSHASARPKHRASAGRKSAAPAGFCTQCGQPLHAGDAFCVQCGAPKRAAPDD